DVAADRIDVAASRISESNKEGNIQLESQLVERENKPIPENILKGEIIDSPEIEKKEIDYTNKVYSNLEKIIKNYKCDFDNDLLKISEEIEPYKEIFKNFSESANINISFAYSQKCSRIDMKVVDKSIDTLLKLGKPCNLEQLLKSINEKYSKIGTKLQNRFNVYEHEDLKNNADFCEICEKFKGLQKLLEKISLLHLLKNTEHSLNLLLESKQKNRKCQISALAYILKLHNDLVRDETLDTSYRKKISAIFVEVLNDFFSREDFVSFLNKILEPIPSNIFQKVMFYYKTFLRANTDNHPNFLVSYELRSLLSSSTISKTNNIDIEILFLYSTSTKVIKYKLSDFDELKRSEVDALINKYPKRSELEEDVVFLNTKEMLDSLVLSENREIYYKIGQSIDIIKIKHNFLGMLEKLKSHSNEEFEKFNKDRNILRDENIKEINETLEKSLTEIRGINDAANDKNKMHLSKSKEDILKNIRKKNIPNTVKKENISEMISDIYKKNNEILSKSFLDFEKRTQEALNLFDQISDENKNAKLIENLILTIISNIISNISEAIDEKNNKILSKLSLNLQASLELTKTKKKEIESIESNFLGRVKTEILSLFDKILLQGERALIIKAIGH
ncbi:MAG: hypothetical protein FWC41_04850, partial [Firmicutes bacterium]|nr:hypothetical protein [Bacillota bacterium]